MLWTEIRVNLLSTLRMTKFGLAPGRLQDLRDDNLLLVGMDDELETIALVDGKVDESRPLLENSRRRSVFLQLHIHVTPDLKGRQ